MPRERWTRDAAADLSAALSWIEENRGLESAARVALDVADAVERAGNRPGAYPWVGSVHPRLTRVRRDVRRALTRTSRHAVFFRYIAETDELVVLAVRGPGQNPPRAVVLGRTPS